MKPPTYVHRDPEARVLLFSLRNLAPQPSRCSNYELEDVIAELDRADVIAPLTPCGPPAPVQRALWGKLGRGLPLLRELHGSLGRAPLERDYDVVFVTCQNPGDLLHLGPLAPWRERCRKAVVYVDEAWAHTLSARPGEMAMLAQFDHIFCGQELTVSAMAAMTGQPVSYLPVGVDTQRFCPWPDQPERTIDVFNMGRRSPVTHAAFKVMARDRGMFYMFDTLDGQARVRDPRDHREQLANLIKRSRYFVTNVAKITAPEETGGQQEVGFRFYEGAAAGAVLVGEAPSCQSFDQNFGWEDAVIHMPYGTPDPAAVLDALDADPERVDAIRRRNVASSLRRHDIVYRWERVLETIGLLATPAVAERRERLAQRAAEVEGGVHNKNGGSQPTRLRRAA